MEDLRWACQLADLPTARALLAKWPRGGGGAAAGTSKAVAADIAGVDRLEGSTVLHFACAPKGDGRAPNDHVKMLQLLIAHHGAAAFINRPNKAGDTPLMVTCRHDDLPGSVELLLRGADASLANRFGDTALHICCRLGHAQLASRLLGRLARLPDGALAAALARRNALGAPPAQLGGADIREVLEATPVLYAEDATADPVSTASDWVAATDSGEDDGVDEEVVWPEWAGRGEPPKGQQQQQQGGAPTSSGTPPGSPIPRPQQGGAGDAGQRTQQPAAAGHNKRGARSKGSAVGQAASGQSKGRKRDASHQQCLRHPQCIRPRKHPGLCKLVDNTGAAVIVKRQKKVDSSSPAPRATASAASSPKVEPPRAAAAPRASPKAKKPGSCGRKNGGGGAAAKASPSPRGRRPRASTSGEDGADQEEAEEDGGGASAWLAQLSADPECSTLGSPRTRDAWVSLVRDCAKDAGRAPSNVKRYVGAAAVSRQLAALGPSGAGRVLELGRRARRHPNRVGHA
jgi:hypothetical protein